MSSKNQLVLLTNLFAVHIRIKRFYIKSAKIIFLRVYTFAFCKECNPVVSNGLIDV